MTMPPVRILCIEDNAMNWRLVQRLLSQAGYDMHWAEDGLKGCEMALELKPALILLDINLPGLSGFEVATKLRQDPGMQATLIVALTAKTMRHDRESALVTGCDGFISKPIDPFRFVGQVEAYLGGHRDSLEHGREGEALRQFSQRVVEHLETQLRQAQEGNQKLLEARAESERRSLHLSSLLALSKDIILVRDAKEILERVLGQLYGELQLDGIRAYRVHGSGAYFQGHGKTQMGFEETAVLPASHPIITWAENLPSSEALTESGLRQSGYWEHGIHLGLWGPKAQALLLPLQSRSGEGRLWGLLVGSRMERPFQPFEIELAALHAGMLQVSLENAALIASLAETNQALGTSYEGLESAFEALKEAKAALGAQDRQAALGGLFLNMAKEIQTPVRSLEAEIAAISAFMGRQDRPPPEGEGKSRRSMDRIRLALSKVDGLVQALLRRAERREPKAPEWTRLHDLLKLELDLLRAEGLFPSELPVSLDLQAPKDDLYGISTDFAEILDHLIGHALQGSPGRITFRTWGSEAQFSLDIGDDGPPIRLALLEAAFEPFPDLRPANDPAWRRPGKTLPECAQLLATYGGTIQLLPQERGSLIRLNLPLD